MNSRAARANSRVRSTAVEVELVAEEDLADGRADGGAGDHAERADADDDDTSFFSPARKSSCLPAPTSAGQLREERGLDRLEQQDRDAGDEEARR